MSAESILNKQGITLQQAKDFIDSNVKLNQPEVIFSAALDHAVTTSMLNEISGYSIDVINTYFSERIGNYESRFLDDIGKLVNSNLGELEILVDFNDNSEGLSTESLRGSLLERIKDDSNLLLLYEEGIIEPIYDFQKSNGYIYDPEELGVRHLNNVVATDEKIESLFYGTLINIFKRLDNTELDQIQKFSGDQNSDAYRTLLLTSLNTIPSDTVWTATELANIVVNDAQRIVNDFPNTDFIGILDSSYLGLSVLSL